MHSFSATPEDQLWQQQQPHHLAEHLQQLQMQGVHPPGMAPPVLHPPAGSYALQTPSTPPSSNFMHYAHTYGSRGVMLLPQQLGNPSITPPGIHRSSSSTGPSAQAPMLPAAAAFNPQHQPATALPPLPPYRVAVPQALQPEQFHPQYGQPAIQLPQPPSAQYLVLSPQSLQQQPYQQDGPATQPPPPSAQYVLVAAQDLQQQQPYQQYQQYQPATQPPLSSAQYMVVAAQDLQQQQPYPQYQQYLQHQHYQQQQQPWAQYQPHTPSPPPPSHARHAQQQLQRTCASSYGGAQQQQHANSYNQYRHQTATQPATSTAGPAEAAAGRLEAAGTTAAATAGGEQRQQGRSGTSKVNAPLLTARLKAATSTEQLLQLVQQHAADLNHIHMSAAYTQAVKLFGRGAATAQHQATATLQQQLLSELHQLAVQLQQQFGARGLANIIWSCGKLSSPATARLLLPLLLRARTLQQTEPQHVSNVLWAAATLKLQLSTDELQQLLGRLEAVLGGAQPQHVSNTLWAVASMGQQVPPLQQQQLLGRLGAVLPDATPQHVSNTLWAVATMGQQVAPQQLQQLLGRLEAVLPDANPQHVSNTLWAVATMGQQVAPQQLQQLLGRLEAVLPGVNSQVVANTLWAVATMGQQVPPQQLRQLLGRLEAVLPGAKPQEVSNTLWAVATMRQTVPPQQLQQLLGRLEAVLQGANPQNVSNTLWAVATMGQQLAPQQLQLVLAAFHRRLTAANVQQVATMVWACGKMQHLPLQLLQSLNHTSEQLQQLLAAAKPQELANMVWACGELGYAAQLLPGALLQRAVHLLQDVGTGFFKSQELCILCWSAAVLDLQQCVPQVLLLAAGASQLFSTASDEDFQQLHQVHLWLLDSQLPTPGQGLLGVLTQQQLEQCRDSWEQQLTAVAQQQSSRLQQSVYEAMLHLPPGILQQQPQPEQHTANRACLIDIAAVTASGIKLAIEVEGPHHYVQPGNTLTGPTLFRNRALAARGFALISVPYWEWDLLHSAQERQQYLLGKMSSLGG